MFYYLSSLSFVLYFYLCGSFMFHYVEIDKICLCLLSLLLMNVNLIFNTIFCANKSFTCFIKDVEKLSIFFTWEDFFILRTLCNFSRGHL